MAARRTHPSRLRTCRRLYRSTVPYVCFSPGQRCRCYLMNRQHQGLALSGLQTVSHSPRVQVSPLATSIYLLCHLPALWAAGRRRLQSSHRMTRRCLLPRVRHNSLCHCIPSTSLQHGKSQQELLCSLHSHQSTFIVASPAPAVSCYYHAFPLLFLPWKCAEKALKVCLDAVNRWTGKISSQSMKKHSHSPAPIQPKSLICIGILYMESCGRGP